MRLVVCMLMYNEEKMVADVLNSVLNQTFKDFELFCFDNKSTDNTVSIVEEFCKKDVRIHVFKNSINLGASENYNRCLGIAGGEFFAFKSANDIIAPEYFEKCISLLENDETAILAYTNGTNVTQQYPLHSYDNNDIVERCKFFITDFRYGNIIWGVYRRKNLDKVLRVLPLQNLDFIFLFNCLLFGKFKFINEVLYNREVVDLTEKQYGNLCHTSLIGRNNFLPYETKIVESLFGIIHVLENGYNELNDEQINEIYRFYVNSFEGRLNDELKILNKTQKETPINISRIVYTEVKYVFDKFKTPSWFKLYRKIRGFCGKVLRKLGFRN